MSSAARATGHAATLARSLRDASGDADRRDARDALAGVLRAEALRVLVVSGIPAQARDDLAQAVTVAVLGRIVEGAVAPGFEDGYIAVAAKNRARDWHREQSGVYDKRGMYDEDALAAPDLDPYAVLERAEDGERLQALSSRVAEILDEAPARYRDVLVAVYLESVPIDSLVEQELVREWPSLSPDDDRIVVRRRARARIDKLLQRARDWMRARLLAAVPGTRREVSR
jgi:DNA-directed RNA polymerase specialized sigma24 family protein